MPVICCPYCASKYRVDPELVGCILPCSHCGKEWQAAQPHPSSWRRATLLIVTVLASFVVLFLFFAVSSGSGSPDGAVSLRALVEPIANPEAGEGTDPEYATKRFSNGEWVLGISRDSHGILCRFHGGGTVVLKDSRGQIHCFFGHVCGPGWLRNSLADTRSVNELYQNLTKDYRFTEYYWP